MTFGALGDGIGDITDMSDGTSDGIRATRGSALSFRASPDGPCVLFAVDTCVRCGRVMPVVAISFDAAESSAGSLGWASVGAPANALPIPLTAAITRPPRAADRTSHDVAPTPTTTA